MNIGAEEGAMPAKVSERVRAMVTAGLVVGCVGFFWPSLYLGSVTLFLLGSVLFLAAAFGAALLEHGPST